MILNTFNQILNTKFIYSIHYDGKNKVGVSLTGKDTIFWFDCENAWKIYCLMRDAKKHKKSAKSIYLKYLSNLSHTTTQYRSHTTTPYTYKDNEKINFINTSTKINTSTNVIESYRTKINNSILELAKTIADDIIKELPTVVEENIKTELPTDLTDLTNGYGLKLHVCQKTSSCMFFLALGFNQKDISNVIYYSLKSTPNDIYVILNADINTYKAWINSPSLGKFYNYYIKGQGLLLKSLAKENT